MITWHAAGPHVGVVGKLSGGIFVYAMSIPDAYRAARLNWVRAQLRAA